MTLIHWLEGLMEWFTGLIRGGSNSGFLGWWLQNALWIVGVLAVVAIVVDLIANGTAAKMIQFFRRLAGDGGDRRGERRRIGS